VPIKRVPLDEAIAHVAAGRARELAPVSELVK